MSIAAGVNEEEGMNKKYLQMALLAVILCWAVPGVAQDYFYSSEMSLEKYNSELKTWQTQIVQLEQQKLQIRQEIEVLKEEIAQAKEEITRTRHETLSLLSAIVSFPDKQDKSGDKPKQDAPQKPQYPNPAF